MIYYQLSLISLWAYFFQVKCVKFRKIKLNYNSFKSHIGSDEDYSDEAEDEQAGDGAETTTVH